MSENVFLSRSSLLFGKSVAIVGGGPAGLTLARLLQSRGVDVHVFERHVSVDSAGGGGSLDLHEASGQLALERCGLLTAFLDASRPEAQQAKILDRKGTLHAAFGREQDGTSKPEIDRARLVDILRSSLTKGTLRFGKKLQSLEAGEGGAYLLHFEGGMSEHFDIVVGCDGMGSCVRQFLTDEKPVYTGVTFIETRLVDADRAHQSSAELVGPGSVIALGSQRGLLSQRNGDGSIRVYVARRIPEHWTQDSGIDLGDAREVREHLMSWFADWAPSLVDMLRHSEDRFYLWPLHVLYPTIGWRRQPGITVIGDAAHVMPPFLGMGANMAMLDALELAQHWLDRGYVSLDDATSAFEQSMRDRMCPLIEQSLAMQDVTFAEDAPRQLVEVIGG